MCYGGPDPKHAMREIEARVAQLSPASDTTQQGAPASAGRAWASLRSAMAQMLRKGPGHV